MGGHTSQSSGVSNSNSQFQQDIPQFQQDALSKLYDTAQGIFNSTNNATQGQVPQVSSAVNGITQSALPAYQNNLNGGAYGGLNFGQQLSDSLGQTLNNPSNTQQIYSSIMGGNGNTSLDAMKKSLEANAARTQNLNQAGNAGQAAAAGMSGSSRQGVYDALNNQMVNQNLQNTEANLGYDTFNTDLQNKLGIAQQADYNTLQRQQMLSGLLGQQQGTVNNALANGSNMQNLAMGQFAPTMIPWQNMSNYSNVVGAPTVLSKGTSVSSGSSNSKGGGGGILTS
jgi:hypothetical protein